jgi:F0F1-type ATP synthase assembly protein I
MGPEPQDKKRERAPIPNAADYMGVGIQFIAAILVFLFLGRWLDEKLGTAPWLLIGGVFVGFGLSFASMYYRLTQGGRKRGEDEK